MNCNLRLLIFSVFLNLNWYPIFSQTNFNPISYMFYCYADGKVSSSNNGLNCNEEMERTIREINQHELSDSPWKVWQGVVDSNFIVPTNDSSGALKKLASGTKKIKRAVEMLKAIHADSNETFEEHKAKLNVILKLEHARVDLEESIQLNPYDHRTQKWLLWVFQRLADLHVERESYCRSATMLEYIAYILKDDPQIYYKLGENYLWLENWQKARENLQKSINLILDTDWETINTDELFSHYSLRAEAEINLGMVQQALLTLNYAGLIAPSADEKQRIQWKIDWINWDDGNLDNSIRYDQLKLKFNNCSDYHKLKSEFLEFLNQLTTTKAKNEIHWQVAKLEFQYLNQKTRAIERLYQIVKMVKIDSTGMAIEPDNQKYLYDYGLMCFNLGVENLKKNKNKLAYIYFTQSATIYWNGIGKSYLHLASLSAVNNDVAIELCNKALSYKNSLTRDELYNTYQLLANSYKRKGNFNKAEQWYRQLANIQL